MTTTVTAAAVSKNFGAYQDAAVRGAVIIPRTAARAPCCWLTRILSGCRSATGGSNSRQN